MAAAHTSSIATNSNRAPCQGRDPSRLSIGEVRTSVDRAVVAWGFGSAFASVTGGAVYAAFARQLGASHFVFGVLAAALPLMSLLQVFAAQIIQRTGRSKLLMIVSGLIARGTWIFMPLLPWVSSRYPHLVPREQLLPLLIIGILVSGASQAFTTPSFFTWMSAIVPLSLRSSFFAQRIYVGTWVGLAAVLVSGALADRFPSTVAEGFILAVSGILGCIDILYFLRVPEPVVPRSDIAAPPFLPSLVRPLGDRAVRNFLIYAGLLAFSASVCGPFVWLYCLEDLALSKTLTGVVLVIAPALGVALSTRYWSDVIKQHGNRPVLRFGAAVLVFGPLGWVFARQGMACFLALCALQFVCGAAATSLDVALQTSISRLYPAVPRSVLTALFYVVYGVSCAGGTLMGGAIAGVIGEASLHLRDIVLNNYQVLFLLSMAARLGSALIAGQLVESGSSATRSMYRTILPELASSLSARINRPFGWRSE